MEADDKGLALADAKAGSLKIYVLTDPENEQILDTKFFTYGGPILTALADILCDYLVLKNVAVLGELATDGALEKLFAEYEVSPQDEDFQTVAKLPAMLWETYPQKKQIALAARAAMGSAKLKAFSAEGKKEADVEWSALSDAERLERIEECLNDGVRAMLAGDGGGLEVVEIKDEKRVVIRYQGACAGCGAAGGGTLYYIEDQLQQNVYYGISVEPEDNF
ncbi:hypothetical protein AGMMS49938_07140 [Fibrobacterales bacterium]|nr:hypothetical protein AGMMS49938_07140 [Fibrobacterales bacterium]